MYFHHAMSDTGNFAANWRKIHNKSKTEKCFKILETIYNEIQLHCLFCSLLQPRTDPDRKKIGQQCVKRTTRPEAG